MSRDRVEELTAECLMDLRPWPQSHVLPVKCRAARKVPTGKILRDELTYAPGIQIHLASREIVRYRTIDDLLDAGWVID